MTTDELIYSSRDSVKYIDMAVDIYRHCLILLILFTTAFCDDYPYFGDLGFSIVREERGDFVYSNEIGDTEINCGEIKGSEYIKAIGCLCDRDTFILAEEPFCFDEEFLNSDHPRLIRFENQEHDVYLMKADAIQNTKVSSLVFDDSEKFLTKNKCGNLSVINATFAFDREELYWEEFESLETVVKTNGQFSLKVEIGDKMRDRIAGNLINITLGSFKGKCNGTLLMKFEGEFVSAYLDYRVNRRKDVGDTIYCDECGNLCADFKDSEQINSNTCRCNNGTLLLQPQLYCLREGADINTTMNDLGPHHPRLIRLKNAAKKAYIVYTIDLSKEKYPPLLMMFADSKGSDGRLMKSKCGGVSVNAVTTKGEKLEDHNIRTQLGYRGDYYLKVFIDKNEKWLEGELLNITISSYSGNCNGTVMIKIKGLSDSNDSFDEEDEVEDDKNEPEPEIPTSSEETDNHKNIDNKVTLWLTIACVIGFIGIVLIVLAFIFYRRLRRNENLYIRPPPPYPGPFVGHPEVETEHEYEYIGFQGHHRQHQPSPYVNRPDIIIETKEDRQEPDIVKAPAFPHQNSAIPGDFYVNGDHAKTVGVDENPPKYTENGRENDPLKQSAG